MYCKLRTANCILLLIVLSLISANKASSQTGEIRGFIYEKESSEAAIYTSVYLKGTNYGTQTNIDGYFIISKIPVGDYTLQVTSVGYDTIRIPVAIKSGDLITKKIFLNKSAIQMKEVEVSAETEQKKTEVRVSVNKITPKELRQVPTIGGEPDLAQYLQILPGVITSGDQGGQLYIRGGTPIQNKVLLDGMTIYNPFHSIGLFSVFDADIIRGADVYTGGFNAEYGDRISSVMDITTRDGNKKRIAGKVLATTFNSKVLLEGPLKKEKEGDEGSSSFLFTAKKSYIDKTSKTLYNNLDTAGLPYSFTDFYGKISLNSFSGSKVNFFGFRFEDHVDYTGVTNLNWISGGFGTNFLLIPAGSSVLIEGNFAYSNYEITMNEPDGQERFSSIGGFNTGLNFTYFFGKDEMKYGLEVNGIKTDYAFTNAYGVSNQQAINTTEMGAFFKYKVVTEKFVIEPGLRGTYYSSQAEFSLEPRFGIKYNMSDKVRFKAAGGFYSQNLLAATSDRDVVNLFYGFLSGPDKIPHTFDGEEVTTRLQKARHLVFGVEVDLPHHIALNVEGYFKDFTQLENINRDKIYEDDAQHQSKPEAQRTTFIIETGTAQGVDFLLKYDYKKLYLWVVYSLGYVTRYDGVRTYEPGFDRRHNINLVASYRFGKKDCWQTSARWNYGSPFPFTQTQGYYEQISLPGGIGSNILNQNGALGINYATLNGGRLSPFHRLDLSIQRAFFLSKNSTLEITASVTNVYDRDNIFYINRVTNQKIYQLPVLPSLGASLTF